MRNTKVELGDEVIDTVSGFKGIAFSRTEYLHGCSRITIAPKVKKDGTVPDSLSVDEPQLRVLKKKSVAKGSNETGGYKPDVVGKVVPERH